MNLGPYRTIEKKLTYKGNKLYSRIGEIRGIHAPDFSKRHLDIKKDCKKWDSLIRIWDRLFRATTEFMQDQKALLFDLPITTRMISSPGALTGTIPSDVDPFEIDFFNNKTFLTQSSQLYLEFAITNSKIDRVYCWEKSFRREKADFRHLPEFTHIEFEGNMSFGENLRFQRKFIQYLIGRLIRDCRREMEIFLTRGDLEELKDFVGIKNFPEITFHEAFRLLKKETKNKKYDQVTIKNFGAYEEVLLTQIIKTPVFVKHYIGDEVAFYHAPCPQNSRLVMNADFLFPGYGEVIGSGERVHTRRETYNKAKHFELDLNDYQAYIDSRDPKNPKIHSGWGMGVERFLQVILKLPFIWDTKPFPRVDRQNRP